MLEVVADRDVWRLNLAMPGGINQVGRKQCVQKQSKIAEILC